MTAADVWSYAPVALWLAALVAVFRLETFERKWAWVILACVYIEVHGVLPGGRGTGLPVGAVMVLLVAIFGRSPRPSPRRRPLDLSANPGDEASGRPDA